MDGLAFFPTTSWPHHICQLLAQTSIGDTDTFKLFLFAYGNGMSPYLIITFLLIRYHSSPSKTPKRIHQIQWIINNIPEKQKTWYYFDIAKNKYLHLDGTPLRYTTHFGQPPSSPLRPPQHHPNLFPPHHFRTNKQNWNFLTSTPRKNGWRWTWILLNYFMTPSPLPPPQLPP